MADHRDLLADRTLLISGAGRGIALAIGIGAARQGANVVLPAKTDKPHPTVRRCWRLPAARRSWPTPPSKSCRGRPGKATGGCHIDEEVLAAAGGYDLSRYGGGPQPIQDFFIG